MSWISDHLYRPAEPGDRHYNPHRRDNDQPCGDCGTEWAWHRDDDTGHAA